MMAGRIKIEVDSEELNGKFCAAQQNRSVVYILGKKWIVIATKWEAGGGLPKMYEAELIEAVTLPRYRVGSYAEAPHVYNIRKIDPGLVPVFDAESPTWVGFIVALANDAATAELIAKALNEKK